jgi:hypothetical protein
MFNKMGMGLAGPPQAGGDFVEEALGAAVEELKSLRLASWL